MKQTISVLVENQAGVLNRITGLFSRRAFNIESLAVGVTDDPTISRITIIVDSGNSVVEQVEKAHQKALDILQNDRAKLDELAKYLHEKETITGDEFMSILGGKDGSVK